MQRGAQRRVTGAVVVRREDDRAAAGQQGATQGRQGVVVVDVDQVVARALARQEPRQAQCHGEVRAGHHDGEAPHGHAVELLDCRQRGIVGLGEHLDVHTAGGEAPTELEDVRLEAADRRREAGRHEGEAQRLRAVGQRAGERARDGRGRGVDDRRRRYRLGRDEAGGPPPRDAETPFGVALGGERQAGADARGPAQAVGVAPGDGCLQAAGDAGRQRAARVDALGREGAAGAHRRHERGLGQALLARP